MRSHIQPLDIQFNIIHTKSVLKATISILSQARFIVRWDHWYDTKIPLFFLISYTLLYWHGVQWDSIEKCVRLLVFTVSYLAFAYFINDLSDRQVDQKAGKNNATQNLPFSVSVGVSTSLFLLSFISIPVKSPSALFLYTWVLFSGLFYSLPPFRFKERGILGLIVASIGQRSLPALLFFDAFNHWRLDTLLFFLLYFFIGLRSILGHQIADRELDQKAGIKSYATQLSRAALESQVMTFFILEIVFLLLILHDYLSKIPQLAGFLGIYLIILGVQAFNRIRRNLPISPYSPPWLPFHGFYFILWPIGLAIGIAMEYPTFWLAVLANIIWQQWGIRQEWAMIRSIM